MTWINVQSYGATGNGSANPANVPAFNEAIAAAAASEDTAIVYVPSGVYDLAGSLEPITSSNIWIIGDSSGSSILRCYPNETLIQWGTESVRVDNCGIRDLGFFYAEHDQNAPANDIVLYALNGSVFISNISLTNVATFFQCGSVSAPSTTGAGAYLESTSGYSYYDGSSTGGYPLVNIERGGGVWMHDWNVMVGAGGINSPVIPDETLSSAGGNFDTAHMLHGYPAAMSTSATLPPNEGPAAGGINFVQIMPHNDASVDTVYMSNILAQRYTCGIYGYCGPGAIDFLIAINTTFDNSGQDGVYLTGDDSGSWSVNDCLFSNCIACGWDRYGFAFTGPELGSGLLQNIQINNCYAHQTGMEGFYFGAQCRNVFLSNAFSYYPNRFKGGTAAGIRFEGNPNATGSNDELGATGFTVTGGGTHPSTTAANGLYIGQGCSSFTVSGVRAYGTEFGLQLGGSCESFSITANYFKGGRSDILVNPDLAPPARPKDRRIHNNVGVGYAGPLTGTDLIPSSGASWVNTTPFVLDVYIYGGLVKWISKESHIITEMQSGSVRLDPGEEYTVSYTSTPFFTHFIQQ